MFSAILTDAYRDKHPGIPINYRADGRLLNIRRMQAPTCVYTATVHGLLFADDYALNTTTEADMQKTMDLFAAGCANFDLTINTEKTVVMHQPPPGSDYNIPRINVSGAELQNVDSFAHLGSTLCSNTQIYDEAARRISKASQAFGRLQASVWNHRGLQMSMKLKMYKAVVLTTLLNGVETWTVYSNQCRRLNHFHLSCLYRILKMAGKDSGHGSPGENGSSQSQSMLRQIQLRWCCHVVWMKDHRLPKRLFYGDVAVGARAKDSGTDRDGDTPRTSHTPTTSSSPTL